MSFIPLMTALETSEWKYRIKAPSQLICEEPYKAAKIVRSMYRARLIELAKERPHEYLANLIVLISSRVTRGQVKLELAYSEYDVNDVTTWNTPEGRWWTDKFLEAVANMPLNYAMSAAIRYLRGNGKQAKIKSPGVGIMSADTGWKNSEVSRLTDIFFSGDFGAPCYDPEYIGNYSEFNYTCTAEELDAMWEKGVNMFALMRAEKDLNFIAELRSMLKSLGMTAPAPLKTKALPKPRKVKQYSVGDKLVKSSLRDLPDGTIIVNNNGPIKYRCATQEAWDVGWGTANKKNICVKCKDDLNFYHETAPGLGVKYQQPYIWRPCFDKHDKVICRVEDPTADSKSYFKVLNVTANFISNGFVVVTLPQKH